MWKLDYKSCPRLSMLRNEKDRVTNRLLAQLATARLVFLISLEFAMLMYTKYWIIYSIIAFRILGLLLFGSIGSMAYLNMGYLKVTTLAQLVHTCNVCWNGHLKPPLALMTLLSLNGSSLISWGFFHLNGSSWPSWFFLSIMALHGLRVMT